MVLSPQSHTMGIGFGGMGELVDVVIGRHAQLLSIWEVVSFAVHAVAQEGREVGFGAGV
jgi:hypothetical protein